MAKEKSKVLIVGAGPGGLAAGMLLAHRGFIVEIFEKADRPGGRTSQLILGDYKFDVGPTFFMMDFILREIFQQCHRSLEDYLFLNKLSPMYRLFFSRQSLEVFSEKEKMAEELSRIFPGTEKGLDNFYRYEAQRLTKLFPLLSQDNNHWQKIFSWSFLSALPFFSLGRSLYQVLGNYFKQEFARLAFTFQAKYLGMSPWKCPGAFAMVPYVEHAFGVYHIRGGLSEISTTMAKIITEEGGIIHYNSQVSQLLLRGKKVIGVRLVNGQEVLADNVIINADFAYAMTNLIPSGILQKYKPAKLAKKKYSCSIFMMYLGLNCRLPSLAHHNIIFANDYQKNVREIFNGRLTEKDFSFYVRDATAVDPTLAPPGKTALYVLVPVPNNQAAINWDLQRVKIRAQVFNLLSERLSLNDLSSFIEEEKIITPDDWQKEFNVYQGAVFNLSHHLRQMLWWRPHNKFEELENCYLVGGGTHPGSGLPTIYKSGQIVADLISRQDK